MSGATEMFWGTQGVDGSSLKALLEYEMKPMPGRCIFVSCSLFNVRVKKKYVGSPCRNVVLLESSKAYLNGWIRSQTPFEINTATPCLCFPIDEQDVRFDER